MSTASVLFEMISTPQLTSELAVEVLNGIYHLAVILTTKPITTITTTETYLTRPINPDLVTYYDIQTGNGIRSILISTKLVTIWQSGIMVSALASINEVNLRRARLILRWVTVSIAGAGHLFQYVTNQPPKANSAFHPSRVSK